MVAKFEPAGDKGTDCRIVADDGGYWVCLWSREALDREGVAMDSCLGDGDYDEYCGRDDPFSDEGSIWSLRDRDGGSVLTCEVWGRQLLKALGRHSHPPSKWAARQVRHLIAQYELAGSRLRISPATGIMAVPDRRTFREDRLPPDVLAALDDAERRGDEMRTRMRASQAVRTSVAAVADRRAAALAVVNRWPDGHAHLHLTVTRRGPWEAGRQYQAGDVVVYAGAPWIALVPSRGMNAPNPVANAWVEIEAPKAAPGDDLPAFLAQFLAEAAEPVGARF